MRRRLLIIGWDGADWDILDDLIRRDALPNTAEMLRSGARGNLDSTVPSHSWSAWPTFLTGRHPAGHGVFDFVGRDPRDPRRRVPLTSNEIRPRTFLEHLSAAGREVRAANIPVTYPPIPVSGRLISGPVVPPGGRFVHPESWAGELERRAPFPPNGLEWQHYASRPDELVAEAADLIDRRTASYGVLLEGDWDAAVCVYLAPDRVQHPLGAYLLPSHPRFSELEDTRIAAGLRDVFTRLDAQIPRLVRAAGSDATVVLMSDHGFRPVDRVVDLGLLLTRLGFATPAAGAGVKRAVSGSRVKRVMARTRLGRAARRVLRAPSAVRWDRTVAYRSTTGGGVSVNVRGREPNGVVPSNEFERVRDEVREALLSFRDPQTGAPVVSSVFRRHDLPPGPYADRAPDLLAVAAPLYSFGSGRELVSASAWPSGNHRRRGIIVATGDGVSGNLGDRSIADVASTVLAFSGIEPPPSDGSPIEAIAGPTGAERVRVSAERERSTSSITREDEDSMAEHLRGLGYIE